TGLNMTTDFTLTESETDFYGRKFTLTTSPTPIADLSESEKLSGDPAYYNQPDPAIANTVMLPAGATQEANRVDLIFRHCFSQIQVNLKKAADGGINDLNAADITKVELLGVSQEGYIFFDADPATGKNHAATYKKVVQSDFTTEELAANEFGTSMEMYDMGSDNYATGYVKSYRAIAFGQLGAIRITWKEDSGVEHIVTHKVVNLDSNDFINLRSGVRYIHNLELRRGTLAVIKTVILPWEIDEQQWNTSGIITEN
ncbi:MAG: fimbrillin family protein, partial [Muribaculaceae bacterium]